MIFLCFQETAWSSVFGFFCDSGIVSYIFAFVYIFLICYVMHASFVAYIINYNRKTLLMIIIVDELSIRFSKQKSYIELGLLLSGSFIFSVV